MKSLAAFLVLALIWLAGLFAFADRVQRSTPAATPAPADGIVALTGPGSSERMPAAVNLLMQRLGHRVLVSGVNRGVTREQLRGYTGAVRRVYDCCVDLGFTAVDTVGNARETAEWARAMRFRSLIVVTSDYHMPRSMAELAEAMPEVTLIPYPVTNPDLHLDDWWNRASAFGLLTREYGKYLLAAARLHLSSPPAAREASARSGS